MIKKPIFATPHHDPKGIYNPLLLERAVDLKAIFSQVCFGVTPETFLCNSSGLNLLKKEGFSFFVNSDPSSIGDHFRSALSLAVESDSSSSIFFGFIDRVLFSLSVHHRSEFIESMQKDFNQFTCYHRTDEAWLTHPKNYRQIEQATNQMVSILTGDIYEMGMCGLMIPLEYAKLALSNSIESDFSVLPEWILTLLLNQKKPKIKPVNWTSWEDPFILNEDPQSLKKERENDINEYKRRFDMNIKFIELLKQERFYPLLKKEAKA